MEGWWRWPELIGVGLGLRRRGIGVANGCRGVLRGQGPFYRVGGWEGRRCGEGNGRRRSAPLMAFTPSVLGG
jgi:hypothetical protein